MSRNEISVNDAFNEYYKLKNKYETNYNKDNKVSSQLNNYIQLLVENGR